MEEFLLFSLIVILLVRWRVLASRFSYLERRIEKVSAERIAPEEISKLIRRVRQLEHVIEELRGVPPEPIFVPTQPEAKVEPPAPEPPKIEVTPQIPPAPVASPPPPRFIPPPPVPTPAPPRPKRSSEEWEALVGGNLLNKLGILVLVIALALFLGYSFTQMGPAGRATTALAVSLVLLGGGVLLERRPLYALFGRGLIAGGWAGLYFTTYAMQAVEAAKVIDNVLLGELLLLAVATGMVLHSLKYRAQAVTGLAYFIAFATLAITPITALSVIALVPLAGSLLFVAYHFSWPGMALFSVAATYATCASRGDSGAPLVTAQIVFATYWLLFEAYDLLRAHRRANHPTERVILPLNALGFGLLSYAKWNAAAPAQIYQLTLGVAVAYLASTILRAVIRPPSSFAPETSTLDRILAGGYEGPITIAAVCSALAAALKLHGQTVNDVLLIEGELLFAAGLVFRQVYPRRLAGSLFAALGVKLVLTDIPDTRTVQYAGRLLRAWTPSAVFASLLFYLNRSLRKQAFAYSYAASALLALILGFEVSLHNLGTAWLALAAMLFVFGWQFRKFDFRMQGYLAGALALGAMGIHQAAIANGSMSPSPHPWIPLALAAAVAYAVAFCAVVGTADRFTETERDGVKEIASWAATASAAALLWKTFPAVYLGPAWTALSLLTLELGLRRWPPNLRKLAHMLAAVGVGRVVFFTVLPMHSTGNVDERIAIGCAAALAYAYAGRFYAAKPDQAPTGEALTALNLASACGACFTLIAIWTLLGSMAVAPVWAVFGVLLMTVALLADLPGLRVQSHLVAAAACCRLCDANLDAGGYALGISYRLWSGAVVVATQYFEWWRQSRWGERLQPAERSLKRAYLYAAAFLIAGLFYLELPAQLLAAGWAALTLVLLVAGRYLNVRDLRIQSYILAAIAFWQALNIELSSSSFFIAGSLRIAVGAVAIACLFVAQLFIPQSDEPESNARLYFSLLATSLATVLLYHEVSGSMLTVAWGIEGAALLASGFPLRDRTMRLSGMALFLLCTGKLFFYDLRNLETLYRILSFFVLGVILVAVSWVYTRFRDRIQRYL